MNSPHLQAHGRHEALQLLLRPVAEPESGEHPDERVPQWKVLLRSIPLVLK